MYLMVPLGSSLARASNNKFLATQRTSLLGTKTHNIITRTKKNERDVNVTQCTYCFPLLSLKGVVDVCCPVIKEVVTFLLGSMANEKQRIILSKKTNNE